MSLENACFVREDDMITYGQAMRLLKERLASVVGTENVPLKAGSGRILAEDIVAERNIPPHDNAAVDGYAVCYLDLNQNGETRLPVGGKIAAGHPLETGGERGKVFRVLTGAVMPRELDTVFMQEDVRNDGPLVVFPKGIKKGANKRRAGEDIQKGSLVIARGCMLRPQEIGVLASLGKTELSVMLPLRVAVFSTGDEIREPGDTPDTGCVFDSNRYAIMALLEKFGCIVSDMGILPDKEKTIRSALEKVAENHHVILTSGGISTGDEDHVKIAVEALGSLHFWRLAIKPGRPVAFGQIGQAVFMGLPGNPVAAMVSLIRIARPVLAILAGHRAFSSCSYEVEIGKAVYKKTGRREWLRGRLQQQKGKPLCVYPFHTTGAGILMSLVESDGLIELSEEQGNVSEGEMVHFFPFEGLFS